MSDIFQIGFFQFDNLVRNRVPFLLLHDEMMDFSELYDHMELEHLKKWAFELKPDVEFEDVMTELQQRRVDLRTPAVIMSLNGEPKEEIAARLEDAGFSNVYTVEGGWNELLKEAKASL